MVTFKCGVTKRFANIRGDNCHLPTDFHISFDCFLSYKLLPFEYKTKGGDILKDEEKANVDFYLRCLVQTVQN
jgi:hypothetical protein